MIVSSVYGFSQKDEVKELLVWRNHILQQKEKPMSSLNFSVLSGKSVTWWDGNSLMVLIDEDEGGKSFAMYNPETGSVFATIKTEGKTGFAKESGLTFTLHKMGETMLLVAKEEGKMYDIFIQVPDQLTSWHFIDTHDVLDGLYITPDNTQYVFGLPEMFEGVTKYTEDPGVFMVPQSANPMDDTWNYRILYGDGRISHGRYVEDPEKRNMPGAGGAGAIMGPMEWGLNITDKGLTGKVLHDEPTVDHTPRITEEFTLTKIQTPFKGINGIWTFASIRPLNRMMLIHFPKEILRLMRNEIYARHGVKFSSDATIQAYFDNQPWYKATANPSPLTGLEMLNVSLIKAVEDRLEEN